MDKQYGITREEAIQILSTRDAHGVLCGYTSGVTEALNMAIEALSADTVSRDVYDKRTKADEEIIDSYRKEFQKILSADAVQGEWHQISPARIYECSICNHNVLTDYIDTYNYCPNCGTIMVKGGDTKSCVFPQKLVAETFYCADGERKGGDTE